MKKLKYIIVWSLIGIYLLLSLGFVAEKKQHLVCNQVLVNVTDSARSGFISDKDILNLLQRKGIHLIGKNFNDIDLSAIENILNNYPPIEEAAVYKTLRGKVVIDISQRTPVLRIIDANNRSYYIDDKGYIMKLSGNYTSRVIIANGHIRAAIPEQSKISVLEVEKNRGNKYLLADLYKLARYIADDDFWNAQVQQIYVNSSGDFELIPRVGAQVILFGDYSDCEAKFTNLMSLYKNGLPAVGWNKYETINLKYKGQIVCTKRE